MVKYVRDHLGNVTIVNDELGLIDLGKAYENMSENIKEELLKKVLPQENVSVDKKPVGIDYKYNEIDFINELTKHVNKTYVEHYSGKIQPVEFVMSNASTLDYLRGNVIKYTYRFGAKNGANPEDLYKACHFLMMMLKYSK